MPLAHRLERAWRRLAGGEPCSRGERLVGLALVPLSWAYRLASFLKRSFFWHLPGTQTRVPALVISIGNPVVGGTGKTPLAALVTGLLTRELGMRAAVLTRGYRARPRAPVTLVGAGGVELVPRIEMGDEAALLVEACPEAEVIVSRRRALGARHAVLARGAEVVVLDDGLQYWRLHRDLDLVTLDARNPFGNGRLFPAGLLREPPAALGRADALVLRAALGEPFAVPELVRRHAAGVPLYVARYRYTGWRTPEGRHTTDLEGVARRLRSVACGIAVPEPFFRAVEDLAGRRLARHAFPDHHRFELAELASLEGPIAMTEKDGMNLPQGVELPEIYLVATRLEVEPLDGAPAFADLLGRLVRDRLPGARGGS